MTKYVQVSPVPYSTMIDRGDETDLKLQFVFFSTTLEQRWQTCAVACVLTYDC